MIISSAPLRISFSGGGTDYYDFYSKYGSAIVGAAINKRVWVFVNELSKFSEEKLRFTYRTTESVKSIEDLNHPVVKAVLKRYGIKGQINIATMADVPGNTGLGSSSAFTVALIAAISRFTNVTMSDEELVQESYLVERTILGEAGGIQDYLHAVYGSFAMYSIDTRGSISREKLDLNQQSITKFKEHCALIRIGDFRKSENFALRTNQASKESKALIALKENLANTRELISKLHTDISIVDLTNNLMSAVKENWRTKRIFQGLDEELLVNLEGIPYSENLAFKVCGAGTSGFLLVISTDDLSPQLTQWNRLDFEIEDKGVEVLEIF